MKRSLPLLFLFVACATAFADAPWISIGVSGPLRPGEGAWTDDVLRIALDEGSATVVADAGGWTLLLDGALADFSGDPDGPSGIRFDGGDGGLPLDVGLSGRNVLLGGGVRAENCSRLSLRGPGSLQAVVPETAADGAAVDCDGDLAVDGALVAAFAGGGAALQAGGNVSVSNATAVLLGTAGIRGGDVSVGASSVAVAADREAVLAAGSAVFGDAECVLVSDEDGVVAARLEFRDGNELSVTGNAGAGTGGGTAVRQTSREDGMVHAGGRTVLYAPGGTGVDAAGTVRVAGGSLSVAAGPDGADVLAFFASPSGDPDEAAVLADFLSLDPVASFLEARNRPDSGVLPEAGVRAENVLVEGGDAAVACRTAAAGFVATVRPSRTAGTATVNGEAWIPAVSFALDANGGSVSPKSVAVPVGESVGELPAAARTGHTFLGWFEARDGGAPFAPETVAETNATLHAHWSRLSYRIAFDATGGTVSTASRSVLHGDAVGALPAPTRSGHVFLGWYTAKTGGSKISASTQATRAATYYARWAKASYKVAFDANGGKGKMSSQAMTYGKAANLAANKFSRKKFVFVGWARTKAGPAAYKNAQSVKNLTENGGTVTLYAQWAKQSYKVVLHPNGGTGKASSLSMKWGKAKTLPSKPFVRGGYAFRGWALSAKDAAAQKVAYKDAQSVKNLVTASGTVTLYAVWKKFVPKTAGRVRIALCQTPTRASSAAAQVDATFAWARANLRGDEDLIVFPELAFAPFTELKTAWKRGPDVWKKVAAFARERKAWVVANHPNRPGSGKKMYNETRVYDPDGAV